MAAAPAGFNRKVYVEALKVEAEGLKGRPDTATNKRRRKEVADELAKYDRQPGGVTLEKA